MLATIKILIVVFTILAVAHTATDRELVIETQLTELMQNLKGKSVAMLTNPTSVDGRMKPLFERILEMSSTYSVTLKCFFAPEHGLRGDHQDGVGD